MFGLLLFGLLGSVALGLIRTRSKSPEERKLLEDNWTYVQNKIPESVSYFLLRLNKGERNHVLIPIQEFPKLAAEMKLPVMKEITQPGVYFLYDRKSPIPLVTRSVP